MASAKEKEVIDEDSTENNKKDEIKITSKKLREAFVKDRNYQEYFVRRAFGGLQSDGNFVMSFFDEQFLPDQNFKPVIVEKNHKCKLTMSKATAKALADWIQKNIDETEARKDKTAGLNAHDIKETLNATGVNDPMVR